MKTSFFIDKVLENYRDSNTGRLSLVPDKFIFAYGPYMCMSKGEFEHECDEISKYNTWMAMLVHAAFLIRKITSGVTYGDAKRIIKEFNISVDNRFGTDDVNYDMKQALMKFSIDYLSKIRQEQRLKGDLESFMTMAAPIVPYEGTVKKKDIVEEDNHADIINDLPKNISEENFQAELTTILYQNLAEILMNYDKTVVLFDDENSYSPNLIKLDALTIKSDSISIATQKYYFLATVNYYGLWKSPQLVKYMKFFEAAGNFNKTQSYSAFEAMVNDMANSTNIDIAAESWDDPTLDAKEEQAVSTIIDSQTSLKTDEEKAKYDFGALNDFINVKRYMKFEEFPNRLFIGSLEKARIININNMGANRNYYEMDNNTVACPFLDLRTYQPAVIVLHANSGTIDIIDDINDLY